MSSYFHVHQIKETFIDKNVQLWQGFKSRNCRFLTEFCFRLDAKECSAKESYKMAVQFKKYKK